MVTRYKPGSVWEMDWSGLGNYGHGASDLTPYLADFPYDYTVGNSLSPYANIINFAKARGVLQLNNNNGRFNLIGGAVDAADMLRPRLCRHTIGGILAWEGRALLDTQALVDDSQTARINLLSRSETVLQQRRVFINNAPDGLLSEKILEFDSQYGPTSYTLDYQHLTFDMFSNVESGPILHNGYWAEFLDYCGFMMGGWFFETPDGTIKFVSLDSVINPIFVRPLNASRDRVITGGPIPGSVANSGGVHRVYLGY